MILQAYADESEREAISISGFIAPVEYWVKFSKKWQMILDDFGAPYFHFREFVTKELYTKPGAPYYDWSDSKRDAFLLDLAELAGEEAIPIGGNYAPQVGEKQSPEEKWETSLVKLFEDLNHVLSEAWPDYAGKILFVFDKGGSTEKVMAARKVHREFSEEDDRYGSLAFEDDKDPTHLPLQAADLCSYVERQFVEKLEEKDGAFVPPETRMLDMLLLRNRHSKLRKLTVAQWKLFIGTVRHHRKGKLAEWKRKGIKQVYYPDKDFPWHIYGNKSKNRNII